MALFEPTAEEKDANSYLEWDDAELGKFAKYVALTLEENRKDAEGLHRVSAASCAMLLVSQCIDTNASEMTLNMEGHTRAGVPYGNWHLKVEKVG